MVPNRSALRIIFSFWIVFSLCPDAKSQGVVSIFRERLEELESSTSDTFFARHCQSIISVVDARETFSTADTNLIRETLTAFTDPMVIGSPSEPESYRYRQRPYILSWVSPTDGKVSFSWLKPPAVWDPGKAYPMYVELHGLWSVAANPIEYMTYPFRESASENPAFEDGYILSPWGRGNNWYQGISETDVWECIAALENLVKVDPARKYLCGHSMGGFGAWYIGSKSVNTWAALGIHAGALWYDMSLLADDVFETLKDIPVYFVVGTMDGLYDINNSAHSRLEDAGNMNTEFVSFPGGHDYLQENVVNMYEWMRNFTNDDWNLGVDEPGKVHSLKEGLECIPNPFRDQTHLVYRLESGMEVSLDIFDGSGKHVRNLTKGYHHSGEHNLQVALNNCQPGIYYLVLETDKRKTSLIMDKVE